MGSEAIEMNRSTEMQNYTPHRMQALSERLRKLGLEARDALGFNATTRFSRTLYHGLLTSVDYKVQCNRDRNSGRN